MGRFVLVLVALAAACSPSADRLGDIQPEDVPALPEVTVEVRAADGGPADVPPSPLSFKVATFNVGTSSQTLHDKDEEEGNGDGYTSTQATYINDYLGNSLAWGPAEDALKAWLDKEKPEIVAFQEIMWDPWCEDAPEPPAGLGLVCEGYTVDRAWTTERLLGADYHLAYTVEQEDLWVGVRKDFGRFDGCPDQGRCTALEGRGVFGDCNKAPRVAGITITVSDGRKLVLVNAHTTAGMAEDDQACRVQQIDQIFLDDGSGQPLAHGAVNLVVGDMNTDPFLFKGSDASADEWSKFVGFDKPFHYISSPNALGPATHVTDMRLDHVASDVLVGTCVVPGETEGLPLIMETLFYDHRPVLCNVAWK